MHRTAVLRFLALTVVAVVIPVRECTSSEPDLPEITGPFDVELKARFNSVHGGDYQILFEYQESNGGNRILLSQNDDTVWFQFDMVQGPQFCHGLGTAITVEQVYAYRFGITSSGIAYVVRDGVLQAYCSGRRLPLNVHRDHYLGEGPSTSLPGFIEMHGAILGIQVLHFKQHNSVADRLQLLNLPGQAFQDGLDASFHARFDDIGSRSGQRVFEFGNAAGVNLNWCGQVSNTNTMECGILQDGISYAVTANNAIEEGVFAFWEFKVDSGGTFRLEKNGSQLAVTTHSIARRKIFREILSFGESVATANDDLDGTVVGFRLQRLDRS